VHNTIFAAAMKSENLNFLEPSGPLQACNGTALPLHTLACIIRIYHDARSSELQFREKYIAFILKGQEIQEGILEP